VQANESTTARTLLSSRVAGGGYKQIPAAKATRERIRSGAAAISATIDRSQRLTRAMLERSGRRLLDQLGLPDQFLGFAMVAVCNEYWRDEFMATDYRHRLLLLPRCLHRDDCQPADDGSDGRAGGNGSSQTLTCETCGKCCIAEFKRTAERLGYRVHVADGTPRVMKMLVHERVGAVLGVACLNVLERALDKVLQLGVPALAVPLLSSACRNNEIDAEWVQQVLQLKRHCSRPRAPSYLPLLRAAHRLFEPELLLQLAPPLRREGWPVNLGQGAEAVELGQMTDLLAATELIGYEWLCRGGKRLRPFITLAAYDALCGAPSTASDPASGLLQLPEPVQRVAVAIETFHKASLVHDDIEDDDPYRYGEATLHRSYGLPVALNVGDYLIGLGYRLLSLDRGSVGGDCAADVLHRMAEAHRKLAEGQGAELVWRASGRRGLTPLDALKLYALKTAPAFDAALYSGLRLAGPAERYERLVAAFARHIGIAFQIVNDLKDWQVDEENKLVAGRDALAARPTVLLALALERSGGRARERLLRLLQEPAVQDERRLAEVRGLYESAGAFEQAQRLVQKYRLRAMQIAEEAEPAELRQLLQFLIDMVLESDGQPLAAQVPA